MNDITNNLGHGSDVRPLSNFRVHFVIFKSGSIPSDTTWTGQEADKYSWHNLHSLQSDWFSDRLHKERNGMQYDFAQTMYCEFQFNLLHQPMPSANEN